MAIIRWSPFQEFTDLKREMDRLFDEFFGRRTRTQITEEKALPVTEIYSPPIDIYEKGGKIVVKAVIPGVKKEDVSVSFLENTLTIRGEKRREEEVKEEDYYHREQYYGSFSRTITLPLEVDPKGMKANYKDGVLEIILPKLKKTKSKEIEVEVL